MSRKYNIKILSDSFEVSVAGDPINRLIISGTNEIYTYSASEISTNQRQRARFSSSPSSSSRATMLATAIG